MLTCLSSTPQKVYLSLGAKMKALVLEVKIIVANSLFYLVKVTNV
jgi:hypothetical protein